MDAKNEAAPEQLLTIHQAADALGLHRWKMRRAVTAGLIPAYRLFNTKRLVRLSEVIAAIEASRERGNNG